ncbi:kelch-like protein 10 isoform X1 [Cimex lectularius]|uniref:BTB domain-containing protein n=1 Tax=Cimex lectularius TaxID=79782 RepID=A0A8I6SCP5_CIMLE|nr:kelch-like protein 10 isoform X1 [Cimex lectularius]
MKVLREHWRRPRPRVARRNPKGGSCCCHKSYGLRSFPKIWTDLRKTDRFCDGVIESSDGKIYRVHRVIMVAASEYFRAVFTSPLAPLGSNARLPFPSDIVDCIVDFCYTGHCHINCDNIERLLPAADQIGVMGIISDCAKFLSQQIAVSNCWGIHSFSRTYFMHQVAHEAREFMIFNFVEFYNYSPEFPKMPVDDVVLLLSDDCLNVRNEECVFYAIHRWIMIDKNEREQHTTKLFQSARLGLVSPSFFSEIILSAPYIDKVDHLFLKQLSLEIAEREKSMGSSELSITPLTKPRIPYEVLFAIGGWSAGAPTNCIETYDIRADRWFLAKQFDNTPRSYHGLVSVDNLLYVIGGFDGSNHFNTVRCHNPVTKEWSEKACMYHARCYVCCVTHGKDIYAIGGFDGRIRMNSAEKFSIAANQWTMINPMNRQRSDGGAAVVGNRIFVVGGFNGQEVLQSAEVYDIDTGVWTMLPPMHTPRSGVSLVYYKGFLYAIGGFSGYVRLSTVERLNPNNPSDWSLDVPDMLTQRSNFACAIMDDMIYVVGGFNGSTTTAYTERFDGNQWHEVSSMNLNRSALAVCLCRGLPNTADYTLHSKLKSNDGNNMTGDGNATGDYLCCSENYTDPVLDFYDED